MKKLMALVKSHKEGPRLPKLPSTALCATRLGGSDSAVYWQCLVEPVTFHHSCSYALDMGAEYHCMHPRRNHYAREESGLPAAPRS